MGCCANFPPDSSPGNVFVLPTDGVVTKDRCDNATASIYTMDGMDLVDGRGPMKLKKCLSKWHTKTGELQDGEKLLCRTLGDATDCTTISVPFQKPDKRTDNDIEHLSIYGNPNAGPGYTCAPKYAKCSDCPYWNTSMSSQCGGRPITAKCVEDWHQCGGDS